MEVSVGAQQIETQRVFCISRNYVKRVEELGVSLHAQPIIFIKPTSCLLPAGEPISMPTHGNIVHQEAELVVLIGKNGRPASAVEAPEFIAGLTLGLDISLFDVQARLNERGLPWELAKSFDNSAPIGNFMPFSSDIDLANIEFICLVNDELRQVGNTVHMVFPIKQLIMAISQAWELKAGDIIYTGTPAGVGPVNLGDTITVKSDLIGSFSWSLVESKEDRDGG